MTSIDRHAKHKYCVELFQLPTEGEYLLQVPANKILRMPKKVVHFTTAKDSITIASMEPLEEPFTLGISPSGQAAFINLYIALEQLRRDMATTLLKIYNTDLKSEELYDILNLTDEQRDDNTAIMWSILSGEEPSSTLMKNYHLITNFIVEKKNV